MKIGKLLVFLAFAVAVALFFKFDGPNYLSFDYLQAQKESFGIAYKKDPGFFLLSYFLVYVIATAVSFPGAAVLTLAGGALFGFWQGLIVVSFASTLGATFSFLITRYLLRDFIQSRFRNQLLSINAGIKKDGDFYLFSLRLVPVVPFFIVNLLLALTPMPVLRFFVVSQLGMLFGTAVYVQAGTQLGQLDGLSGIMSPDLALSFLALGLFPLLSKFILDCLKQKRVYAGFSRPKNFDYNLIVIGAGAGGLVASYIAAAVKAKVALIEREKMGGDCLNTGCIPSKAIIKSSKILALAKKSKDFGIAKISVDFNFSDVMERVTRVIKAVEPHDSKERYTNLGVDCISGQAYLKSPYEVEVGGRVLTTRSIVLATGAAPAVPPIPGLRESNYLTSESIWKLRILPKRLLVLGGGAIGCELSQAFNRLGSAVTIVEMENHLIPREDSQVSEELERSLREEGVSLYMSSKVTKVEQDGQIARVSIEGRPEPIECDALLLALGRRPRVDTMGAKELGIAMTEKGLIDFDPFLRTNFPNIFVCGDLTGVQQLTHAAAHEAWYAAVNALFQPFKKYKVDRRFVPHAIYTDPEIARVGLNEKEAKEKNIDYELVTYGIDDLDRAIVDGEASGCVRILTVPGKDKILGVTIVGQNAGEILSEFVLAMKNNLGLRKILGTVHSYPTMAEANKYAAGNWARTHAPQKVLKFLEKFHSYRR